MDRIFDIVQGHRHFAGRISHVYGHSANLFRYRLRLLQQRLHIGTHSDHESVHGIPHVVRSRVDFGHYAVQPHFDDGHATGIYSWDYLYWLGENQDALWEEYLQRLQEAGASRDAPGAGRDASGAGDWAAHDAGDDAPIGATSVSRPRH